MAAAARSAPGGPPARRRDVRRRWRPRPAPPPAVRPPADGDARWRWRRPPPWWSWPPSAGGPGRQGPGTGTGRGHPTAQATTVSVGAGDWICRVAAFAGQGGRPSHLVVRLDEPADTDGWYTVEAEPANGAAPVPVGAITVENGTGELDAPVPHGTGKVRAIRVIGPDGALHYRAAFPAI